MEEIDIKETYVFGIHAVTEALREGKDISKIFLQQGLKGEASSQLFQLAREAGMDIQVVPIHKLNRITRKNHQGVIAIMSPITYHQVEDLLPGIFESGQAPLFIMLDRVTDVRNFGAICRSAECLGAHAVIIPSQGSAPVSPDAVKTSAGALMKLPVCRERNLKNTIEVLKASGVKIIGCTEKATKRIQELDLTVPTCILMGSEENGISKEYLRKCDEVGLIPMSGTTDSLNVSVSAGIILYEVARQRG